MTNTIAKKNERNLKVGEYGIRTEKERTWFSSHIVLPEFRLQLTPSVPLIFLFLFSHSYSVFTEACAFSDTTTFICEIPIVTQSHTMFQPSMNVYFRTHRIFFFCFVFFCVLFYFALNCIQLC